MFYPSDEYVLLLFYVNQNNSIINQYICSVKVTSAILSVFFLGLILFPCTDEVEGDNCGTEIHFHMGDQDHQADADLCTPFCHCNCCQTHVTSDHTYYKGIITLPVDDHQSNYIGDLGKDFLDPFLRPPQV